MKQKQKQPMHIVQPGSPPADMRMLRNGGASEAVNFAAEDFYKAAVVLKRATDDYKKPFVDLPPGVQSFVTQQFFRMNAAGQMMDALGFQAVTEILAATHAEAVEYINVTMQHWNKVITEEGEVQKIWEALEAEEKAAAEPKQAMN